MTFYQGADEWKEEIGQEKAAGFQPFMEICNRVDLAQLLSRFDNFENMFNSLMVSWRETNSEHPCLVPLCCVKLGDATLLKVTVALGKLYRVLIQSMNDSPNPFFVQSGE